MKTMYTPQQAIEAIAARINCEQLVKLGPLMTDPIEDIKETLKHTN